MNIRPIRTQRDHKAALKEIEGLWNAKPGTRACDRLDVLATLVEAYERKHFPVSPPDPVQAIVFRMEQQGLTRKDLEPLLGSRARVSEVLNHKRELTLPMIRALHEKLGIPAESLIGSKRAG
jgi:HTH-type transcriptional regulator/antitoxin HigA